MRSRTTIQDLAREVGLSKTAVSFAFNSPGRLSPATLARILEAAERLGYVPNPLARGLARQTSGNLGVLVPQSLPEAFVHPHFQELFQGIGAYCQEHQLSLTLIPPLEGCLITAVRNAAVDGVITLGFTPSEPFLELLRRRDLPLVTVDSRVDPSIPSVTFRDREAAQDLMALVLARGYRRIHILTFPPARAAVKGNAGSRSLRRRLQGFRDALAVSGLSDVVLTFGLSGVDGRQAARSLDAEAWAEGRPEVIVCLSDAQAAGVYLWAEARGLRIPEDVAVTGFDGSRVLAHLRPRLTTVRQPGTLKGKLAVQLLEAQWKDRSAAGHLVVKPRLTEGQSLPVRVPSFP